MTRHTRPDRRDWLAGILASTALGLVVLGIGGRVGMRIIALAQGQTAGFSVGGSATVVFLGAGAGAVMGVLFLLSRALFPTRRSARVLAFWIPCLLLVWRGLNPVSVLNVSTFLPLFLLQGALLQAWWCRVHLPRRARSMRASTSPASEAARHAMPTTGAPMFATR